MNTNQVAIVVVAVMLSNTCIAQDSSAIRVSGSVGSTFDVYTMNSTGGTNTLPRRPSSVLRFFANPTLYVSDWLVIPVQMNFTFREAAVIQPSLESPTIGELLTNPMNRFTISPKFGPVQVHLGSVTPRYGSLVVDNVQVFGAGIDVMPGNLKLSATYGILQRGVQADTTLGRIGSYARMLTAVRVGSEPNSETRFGFTFARVSDDESSIPFITESVVVPIPIVDPDGVTVRDSSLAITSPSPLQPTAQEGVSFGFDMRVPIVAGTYLGAEIAGTSFTRNTAAPELSESVPVIDMLMKTRTSTRIDVAGKVFAGFTEKEWGVEGGITYIGPGFVSVTQPFLQPDRVDITVSPRFSVLEGWLSGMATVGWRTTNLMNSLEASSTQLLTSLNITGMISNGFTVTGTFSNFGFRTTSALDTLRYEQVARSLGIMPTYSFTGGDFRHIVMAVASIDQFTDVTNGSAVSADNTTTMLNVSYGISPLRSLWSARVMVAYVSNNLEQFGTTSRSVTLSGNYRLLEGLLQPEAAVVVGTNVLGQLPEEMQLTIRAGCQVRVSKALTGTVRYQVTNASTDDVGGRNYVESLATIGVQWNY